VALYEITDEDMFALKASIGYMRIMSTQVVEEDIARMENLAPITPTIGIYVEGGLVQDITSNFSRVDVIVADMDGVEEYCRKTKDVNGHVIACNCPPEVARTDRDDHAEAIARYATYRALPHNISY
jgi:hypothetical protein